MELFKLLGRIAIDGAEKAKKDIDETSSTIQNLKKKVEEYRQTGLSTSASWKKATEDMKNDTEQSSTDIQGALQAIGAAVTTYIAVEKIVDFGNACITAAADAAAMSSQFSQVFGESEKDATASLKAIAGQAGISENRMKGSFINIAAFAKTTGMETEDALALSERAMVAVADSAAFYDRSLEDVTESLQSFLKGNYENDAALGLSCTETTRNAAANELYGKSFQDLSEAQKQLTLLQMVEDANALSGALGQASRESDTWTNQTGNLNQSWTDFTAMIGEKFLPAATKVVEALSNIVTWMTEHEGVVGVLAIGVGTLATALIAYNVAQALANAEMTLAIAVGTAFGAVMQFLTSPITLVVVAIGALIAIIVLCVKHWDVIKEAAGKAWDFIKGVWEKVATWFDTNIIQPIAGFFSGLWDGIKEAAKGAWDFIKGIWKAVTGWFNSNIIQPISNMFSNLWKGVTDFLKGVFTGNWKQAWNGIKTIFSSVWEGIKTAFKSPINFIISGINTFIRGINKIKIPDWVPVVGGRGFNIAEIPKLEKGGVLEKGQVGLLEGNGAEAVVPLDQNKAWISKVATDMDGAFGGSRVQELLEVLIEMLTEFFPQLLSVAGHDIVTDDGTIIAHYAPQMNEALGKILARKDRGR